MKQQKKVRFSSSVDIYLFVLQEEEKIPIEGRDSPCSLSFGTSIPGMSSRKSLKMTQNSPFAESDDRDDIKFASKGKDSLKSMINKLNLRCVWSDVNIGLGSNSKIVAKFTLKVKNRLWRFDLIMEMNIFSNKNLELKFDEIAPEDEKNLLKLENCSKGLGYRAYDPKEIGPKLEKLLNSHLNY